MKEIMEKGTQLKKGLRMPRGIASLFKTQILNMIQQIIKSYWIRLLMM